MMNDVFLIGRLTKDVILKGEETKVGLFTLAVNRKFLNQEGKREADFVQIKTFKKLAENCSRFLKKGSLVSVKAEIRTGSFEKEGKTHYTIEFHANDVQFLDNKKSNENSSSDNGGHSQQQDNREEYNFPGAQELPNEDWPF